MLVCVFSLPLKQLYVGGILVNISALSRPSVYSYGRLGKGGRVWLAWSILVIFKDSRRMLRLKERNECTTCDFTSLYLMCCPLSFGEDAQPVCTLS